jgi:hypothetical protein
MKNEKQNEQSPSLEKVVTEILVRLSDIVVRLDKIDSSLSELRHDSRRVGVAVDMLKRDVDRLGRLR